MNLRRTRSVARKEFLHILRDSRSLTMALALPLLMILLFGYALTLDVDRDECILCVTIPQDYSLEMHAGRSPKVQLIFDGSDSNTASIALGYTRNMLQSFGQAIRTEAQDRRGGIHMNPPMSGQLRVWYNSDLKSKNYIIPGLIALILMIIGALLTSLTLAREWEMGTMEQLLSTPLRPAEIALGKMMAYFALGIIDMTLTIVIGVLIFHVPQRGSYIFLAATGSLFLIGAMFWGILLSALSRSQLMAYQFAMLTSFLPAFLLSGFVFAIENMPLPIQIVTYLFPTRYFVTILKGIFLRGVGMEILYVEVSLLAAYAALVFLFATKSVSRKVA
jgi:ABC-2 type transport system permease protein